MRTAVSVLVIAIVAGCTGTTPTVALPSVAASAAAVTSRSPSSTPRATAFLSPAVDFPTAAFAGISGDPVAGSTASKLQAVLARMAGTGGMTATVMTPKGTWSGAAGKADGVHELRAESQFGIASITKSIVAAQVMQLVEAGEISLDDPAARYLAGLEFDTNGATVRQLLSHRSGIPDWYSDAMESMVATDRDRVWTTAEVLALVPNVRSVREVSFEYADTNYTVLGLLIEQVRKRPLVEVLRDGVLRVAGTERLVFQPDERPTAPLAMPRGEPETALDIGGGYLPSISDASSAGAAGAIASDSISLAHWWRALCAGEIVSQASLTEMSRFYDGADGYGLGIFNIADPWAPGVGHAGSNFGYVSSAGCLPEHGLVAAVLANFPVDDISGMPRPLVDALAN